MSDTSDNSAKTSSASSTKPRSVKMSDARSTTSVDHWQRAKDKMGNKKVIESLKSQGVDTDDPEVKSKLIQRWAKEYAAKDMKAAAKGGSSPRDSTKQGLKSMERGEGAALRASRSGGASSADSEGDEEIKAALSLKDKASTPWKTGGSSRSRKSKADSSDGSENSAASSRSPSSGKTEKSSRRPSEAETNARKELIRKRGGARPDVFDRPPPAPSEAAGTVPKTAFDLGRMLDDFSASGAGTRKYDCPATIDGVASTVPMTITQVAQPTGHRWAQNGSSYGRGAPGSTMNDSPLWSSSPAPHDAQSWPSSQLTVRPSEQDYRPNIEHWARDHLANGPRTDLDPARDQWLLYTPTNLQMPTHSQAPFVPQTTLTPDTRAPWTGGPTAYAGVGTGGTSYTAEQWPQTTAQSLPSQPAYPPASGLYPQNVFGSTQPPPAINPYTGAYEQPTPLQSSLTSTYGQTPPPQLAPTSLYGPQSPLSQSSFPGGAPTQPISTYPQTPSESGFPGPNGYVPSFGQPSPPANSFGVPRTYGFPGHMHAGSGPLPPQGIARLGGRMVNAA